VRIWSPEHPLADAQGYVFERLALAMKALGKMLPPHAEVHHVNRQGGDNRPGNLVICQDNAYHKLLHSRTEACEACGHADWRRCEYCHAWDSPVHVIETKPARNHHHRQCRNEYGRRRRALRRPHTRGST